MTRHIETTIANPNPSPWQQFLAWAATFEQAVDYDPQAHTDSSVRQLTEVVARLETRLIELEGRDQRTLVSVAPDRIDRR